MAKPAAATERLAASVLATLRRTPKELAPLWFYDERGSILFDRICELPEYYLTRTELDIMEAQAPDMARCIGPQAALIELGSGTSQKTRRLLDCLDAPIAYVPVDIAREHLDAAARALRREYPHIAILPVCADFTAPFPLPPPVAAARRRVVYFPGSTLGNFDEARACALLASMRNIAGTQGAVLIGIDLKKNPALLRAAYNDSAGVTAQFNLNALRHLNRELDAHFDLAAFEHDAVWNERCSRIEMHLVSQRDQVVTIAGTPVRFAAGERIRTECCHKYTLTHFARLAAAADLTASHLWMDAERKFCVQLLQSPDEWTRADTGGQSQLSADTRSSACDS